MVRRSVWTALLAVAFGLLAAPGVRAQSCADEASIRPALAGSPTELSFENNTTERRRVYWIDQDGRRKFYSVVEPGNVLRQPTSSTHAWVVTDETEKCVLIVTATTAPTTVQIGVTAITPPPAGTQQPLGGSPRQAAEQRTQSAPAPRQSAGAEAGVSPIEQYQLRGAYHIQSVGRPDEVLNNRASGDPELLKVKPEWASGHWQFEAVPSTNFVRIQNAWKNTYLLDDGTRLRTAAGRERDEAFHWSLEPEEGQPYVNIINRGSGRALVATRGGFDLVDDPADDDTSLWQLKPAGRGSLSVASAARFTDAGRGRAYEAAVANCSDIGGFWTGSTCRVAEGRTRGCGRGWSWSETAGECLWDGDRDRECPPWMIGRPPNCRPDRDADLTCRGGTLRESGRGYVSCDCPAGSALRGDYPNFRCSASVGSLPVYLVPLIVATGVAVALTPKKGDSATGTQPPGGGGPVVNTTKPNCSPGTTRADAKKSGCRCNLPLKWNSNAVCGTVAATPTVATACAVGAPVQSGCACNPPLQVVGGLCTTGTVVKPTTNPVACKAGQSVATGCVCKPPMQLIGQTCTTQTVIKPTTNPVACKAGQSVSTGCVCKLPMQLANGVCSPPVQNCPAGQKFTNGKCQ